MGNSTTLKDGFEARTQPRKETLQFIFGYSKALEIKKLKSGMEVEMISN